MLGMHRKIWRYRKSLLMHACLLLSLCSAAQCPPNIGFELGSFAGWQCSTGEIVPDPGRGTSAVGLNNSEPVGDIHVMIEKTLQGPNDPFGKFPISCPNGSKFSIKLGNELSKKKAQRVSYTFTIPADDDNYSIIYNYAVVFQNPPDHASYEQPAFKADVYDVTNDSYIGCSSFSYTSSGNLPGFRLSGEGKDVYYKAWTPVTIKLSGYAGKTIRLEFTSNDCTRGGHFGYAYIDVNQNCSSPISGATHCFNDTAQMLFAPYGFSDYRWFTGDFSKQLGAGPTLDLKPLPAAGTKFAVEVTPYPGQGCVDTVFTDIKYSSTQIVLNTPVKELIACSSNPLDLTAPQLLAGSSPGLTLTYYEDAGLTKFLETPSSLNTSGVYYIKAENDQGCITSKPVTLRVTDYPIYKVNEPPVIRRPNFLDLTTLLSGDLTGLTISYWKDSLATIPLPDPEKIDKNGRYFIKTMIEGGCYTIYGRNVKVDEALLAPPNAFSPNKDGVNDTWEIPLLAALYPDCVLDIYNRLGQHIFHSVGYGKTWDGTYKGVDQPVGTYYYVLVPRPDLPRIGGSVTLIR